MKRPGVVSATVAVVWLICATCLFRQAQAFSLDCVRSTYAVVERPLAKESLALPSRVSKRSLDLISLQASARSGSDGDNENKNWSKLALYGGIGFLYWYWMVLGAYAASEGLPGIPSFLPLTPGWPPSMDDLQPALEDSAHFFYLADALQTGDAPTVQPVRLALFNVAEAWVFAFLPALWKDPKRLPRPVLLGLWLVLGINLTNAFLSPYLFVTEALASSSEDQTVTTGKNTLISKLFAGIAMAVAATALATTATQATAADWEQIQQLVQTDRTYLAFVVDLGLFSVFQPLILQRARHGSSAVSALDNVPFLGLIAWLWESPTEAEA